MESEARVELEVLDKVELEVKEIDLHRNLKNQGGPDQEKAEHTSAYTCTTPVGLLSAGCCLVT